MSKMSDNLGYIGVHPYSVVGGIEIYDKQPAFVKIRDARIRNPTLNQVLLIDYDDLQETTRRFSLNTQYWYGRVFITKLTRWSALDSVEHIIRRREIVTDAATNTKMFWYDLSELIRTKFPADKYLVWGAEIPVKDGQITGACVKFVAERLALPLEIELDACWVKDDSLLID